MIDQINQKELNIIILYYTLYCQPAKPLRSVFRSFIVNSQKNTSLNVTDKMTMLRYQPPPHTSSPSVHPSTPLIPGSYDSYRLHKSNCRYCSVVFLHSDDVRRKRFYSAEILEDSKDH